MGVQNVFEAIFDLVWKGFFYFTMSLNKVAIDAEQHLMRFAFIILHLSL
jgi:hypothetical protein